MRWTAYATAGVALMLMGACGEDSSGVASKPASPDERVSGALTLESGESVSYWCAGEGGPGVLLEAGTDSGGTDAYPAAFVDPLVAVTTVCAYDRLGTGSSDPPPHERRTLRDLCAVQEQVVAELRLPEPHVLVGQSGGGNLNIGCAARSPERVAALATIDSYHDDPQALREEGFVWSGNPELVDYVDYSRELDTLAMPIGDFPVLVISATDADPGGEKNQRYWLGLSPHSRQVVIEGPHDLQESAPAEVVAEILEEIRQLEG